MFSRLAALLAVPAIALAAPAADEAAMLNHISPDSMRAHLAYLASDQLEGRGTPSRGQDLAADYIAAQFQRAGLEPAGDTGYFQTAHWSWAERAPFNGAPLTIHAGGKDVAVPAAGLTAAFLEPLALAQAPVVVSTWDEVQKNPSLADGKILAMPVPKMGGAPRMVREKLQGKPLAVVLFDDKHWFGEGGAGWLIDPDRPLPKDGPAVVIVHAADAIAALQQPGATAALALPAPQVRPVTLRNVVGVLRGSDPALKQTYVMLTSHYDHLGVRGGAVYPGANDDGSGTVSVLEIASAMAAMPQRPKRSVVFMTLFGEELGMLGSKYYGKHPIFPVKATVADLNLEQVGRTDDSEGPQVNAAAVTGYDFSTMTDYMVAAGKETGIKVWKHPVASDMYFARSDNQSLADLGVPAHTMSVAYEFPDYHGKGDTFDKVDYANMARVDRMVALALLHIANDPVAPAWTDNPKAAKYKAAAAQLK
jgi:hypothetical protein